MGQHTKRRLVLRRFAGGPARLDASRRPSAHSDRAGQRVKPHLGLRRRARHGLGAALGTAMLVVVVAGCGGATAGGSVTDPTLGVIAPFSGPQAQIGVAVYTPCVAAAQLINASGGILGHHAQCSQIDDIGEAADAVPNVSKALATNSSLVGILGVDSNVAATVAPILNNAQKPFFTVNGLSALDVNHYPYFWRNFSPDFVSGAANALWGIRLGYKRLALITQNDVGDTGNLPGAVKALALAHVQVTSNLTIPGGAPSYQSLITRVIAGHPDGLLISTDEATLGTLLSEYKTLNGGTVPPVLTNTQVLDPKAFTIIKNSTSLDYVLHRITFIGGYVDQTTPQYAVYRQAIATSSHGKFQAALVANGIVAANFDGAIILALAMDRAHSTSGATYDKQILNVTTARPGAVVVHTYAQGVSELKHGYQIQYVGVTGAVHFDRYHNSPGQFAAFAFTPNQGSRVVGVIAPAAVAAVSR